jgi:hypothetical protein
VNETSDDFTAVACVINENREFAADTEKMGVNQFCRFVIIDTRRITIQVFNPQKIASKKHKNHQYPDWITKSHEIPSQACQSSK